MKEYPYFTISEFLSVIVRGILRKIVYMQRVLWLYRYMSRKNYSTISGTLVYFLLMSIAPFLLWLTLLAGNLDPERFLSHDIFSAVHPILTYLKQSAESAASGAGIVLLATSLYSSTNFFYHLRRSGEMIYGCHRRKGGIKLRLSSAAIILITVLGIALMTALNLFGDALLTRVMPDFFSELVTDLLILLFALLIAVLLNIFACPYKMKLGQAISGSLLTTSLWLILALAFTVYMRFANPTRLYGRIASLIIFLLWLYVMMNCLVVGIIYNQLYHNERGKKSLF